MSEKMDFQTHCDICGRTWDLHDASMPQIELMYQLTESHKHTTEELVAYMNSQPDYSTHYDDQSDED
ncbi:hypothetical protein CQ010_01470 [Arthrobacter sp. MYb211]|uniref:hypothetical protein n=1 Tax=unclassified Arthrobacter TaxID=235627 RepID=UPI000CFC6D6F|nr:MULTISPECIES: hypothetical protein [unclassified Arthrobacter]PRA13344.1 hypothetical protein CQ015_03725 [Arthrobacter sp. MYb221]PRC10541.1 hypothetical protein CQ010_01470 [Arthrobacter sp. MYb211]